MCKITDKCSCLNSLRTDVVTMRDTMIAELKEDYITKDLRLVRAGSASALLKVVAMLDKVMKKEAEPLFFTATK